RVDECLKTVTPQELEGDQSGLESVLDRGVQEIGGPRRTGVPDELAREEVAVARVHLQVTREVIGGEQIDLRADVAGPGAGARPEDGPGGAVDGIAVGCAPEEILLEGEREIADRFHADADEGADDVLSSDEVHIPQERVGARLELVEGADVASGLAVAARIVELDIHARVQAQNR